MTRLLLLASIVTLLFNITPSFSQDADPYADYSYLWAEEVKTKKKKTKKKDEVATGVAAAAGATALAIAPADTLPKDTIPPDTVQAEQTVPVDSAQSEENYYDDPFGQGKPVKERREPAAPVEDFRTPLSSEVGTGSFVGGFTLTQINGENYAGIVLNPEFSIGKVGVGLNIPILYGLESQRFRSEIFEGGVGVARLFTYIRYGRQKIDPVYVKVGQLRGTMIGFGGLVNNYGNSTSFERRKVGAHFDVNYQGVVGLEGMYSDFDMTSQNLLAIRPYVRPLAKMDLPIIRTFEVGATFVSDKDQTNIPINDSTSFNYTYTASGINAYGFDAGMTVLRTPFTQIDLFANYSKLNVESDTLLATAASLGETNFANGSGSSFGTNFRFFLSDLVKTDIRIERLSYSRNYLPQFFDISYEQNKDARILSLIGAESQRGIYGSLTGHILDKIQLGGSLLLPDNVSDTAPALVRVFAEMERIGKISASASYVKSNLADLADAFKLDDRSLAQIRLAYHLNQFLVTGVDYYYYWEPGESGRFEAVNYVMPYFAVSIDF